MMNKIYTIGNLTRDPEMKDVGGVPCLNFTVASDTRMKDSDGKVVTNFYTCTAWRQAAETIGKYMHKGDKIAVSGDLVIRPYKDNNGNDRTSVGVTVQDFEFLTTRNRDENSGASASPSRNSRSGGYQKVDPGDTLPF